MRTTQRRHWTAEGSAAVSSRTSEAGWRISLLGLLCVAGVMSLLYAHAGTNDRPLVLGAVYNLHGFQANLDIPSWHGAQLAVAEINQKGGLLGREVQLALVDGMSEPATLSRETERLLDRYPDLPALMGLSDTDMVLAAAPVAAARLRLFLTSGATSPKLPGQVPGYLFLACFGDNVQAAAAAESAWNDLGARTAAVLYAAGDTYTDLLQGYFRARFTGLGGRIATVRTYERDDLDDVAQGLGAVDLVFLATGSADDSLAIIRRLRDADIAVPVFGGDSYDSEQLWQQHPEVEEVYYTTHAYLGGDSPDPVVRRFTAAYADANDGTRPDAFAALGYDTARLLMTAISEAGSSDAAAVREALSGIREFSGVTGRMSYPTDSRIPTKSVAILRITGGRTELFGQLMPKEIPGP